MNSFPAHRRLRVLTLVDGIGTHGGAETLARQIVQMLDQERFEPTFCVSRWESLPEFEATVDELREANVEFIGMRRHSKFDLRPWRQLATEIKSRKIDILHSHKIGSNVWGALLSLSTKLPIFIAHEHTWSFEGNPLRRLLDRQLIARRADAFVAVSKADMQRMHSIEGIPLEKLRFVQNGIPTPPEPDPDADPRSGLGIRPEQQVVGVVAILRSQKALDVLIRARGILEREFPDLILMIVGGSEGADTAQETRLRGVADELGITPMVRFTGLRSDIPELLATMDVAALSSDYEGTPLSVLEYMAAGKPIVSTSVGGVPDLITDGDSGFLVEPQNPEALAAKIAVLLRDRDRARRMGEKARSIQRAQFSIEATTRQVEALYEEIAARKLSAGNEPFSA